MTSLQSISDTIPDRPRKIDPAATFESVVSWIERKSKERHAPGLIVGISGTDSILTFLACAKAFERMGKQKRVLGLNFQHATKNEFVGKGKAFECISSEFNWVAQDIFPWLKEQAPKAQFEIDDSIPHSDDNIRWGHLFSRAIRETNARQGMLNKHYFPVGTRNATEQVLGNYSQISKNVSLFPIIDIYKTEVLEICSYLGVPQIAIDKSREIDCDCGRFDVQANHMQELDWLIMERKEMLSEQFLVKNISHNVLVAVQDFYAEEKYGNEFRTATPYLPEQSLVVTL